MKSNEANRQTPTHSRSALPFHHASHNTACHDLLVMNQHPDMTGDPKVDAASRCVPHTKRGPETASTLGGTYE